MMILDDLAAEFGIEERFVDAHGVTQSISAETKRALLAAMGCTVDDEAGARRALDELRAADGRRVLPPVLVVEAGRAIGVPVRRARSGQWRLVLEDGTERSGALPAGAASVDLGADLPLGYHRLLLDADEASMSLIVTPAACVLPADLREHRAWGLAVQLYLLRSERNWGIGDYGDLEQLVAILGARGADVVGLNPLHAMFLDEPEHASPYSPASRFLLNVLNIDVEAVPEFASCAPALERVASATFRAELQRVRDAALVRYSDVRALKLPVLRMLFDARARDGAREAAFAAFVRDGGEPLRRGCIFQALRLHGAVEKTGDPASPDVARFADERRDEIDFLLWLQFVADEQLAAAAAAARGAGMRVGLYRDLAVGADANGAEVWSNPTAVIRAASAGAPPDIHNPHGQNWGLPPFHPRALRDEGYRSFIGLVRTNMRHAGALRIDHVMALQHLYLVPAGASPRDGAYVRYPLDDLLGIIALESVRNACIVIGEDLGTVPAGFRERMAAANVLSYRVLFFESDPGTHAFLPPDAYPERAVAVIGNHDLPTLRAWLHAADIDERERIGLLAADAAVRLRAARATERAALVAALRAAALVPANGEPGDDEIAVAAHRFLGRSGALLAMAQLDDATGEIEPVNLPTTTDERPNWRRRNAAPIDCLAGDERFTAIVDAFAREGRGRTAVVRS